MKSEFKQEELIREYVREALVLEYAPPGAMGAALKRAVSEPTKRLASVISGKSKQVFASLKNLAKISWGALKELGTLGLLSANYDKIKQEYKDDLNKIEKKHGADINHARETFFNDFSPLISVAKIGLTGAAATAFLTNPLLFMAGSNIISATKEKIPGAIEKVNQKIDTMAYGEKDKGKKEKDKGKKKTSENLFISKNLLNEEDGKLNPKEIIEKHPWLKDAMKESRKAMMDYAARVDSEVKATVSASKLEDLGIPNDIIKKTATDPKAKPADVLTAAKAMKLGEILSKVEAERSQAMSEIKQAFPGVSESVYSGEGSLIYAYDEIIKKIKSNM
jgi:hypothetical protein